MGIGDFFSTVVLIAALAFGAVGARRIGIRIEETVLRTVAEGLPSLVEMNRQLGIAPTHSHKFTRN